MLLKSGALGELKKKIKNLKKGLHFAERYVKITKLSGRQVLEQYAAVAQLDRVFGYEPKGRGFEPLLAYHNFFNLIYGEMAELA